MKLLKYAVQYFHACRNIHTEHPRPRLAGAGRFQLSTVILFLFFFFCIECVQTENAGPRSVEIFNKQ